MKKVLSFVLAAALAAGMTTSAFAAVSTSRTRNTKAEYQGGSMYTVVTDGTALGSSFGWNYNTDGYVGNNRNTTVPTTHVDWYPNSDGFIRADEELRIYMDPTQFGMNRYGWIRVKGTNETIDVILESDGWAYFTGTDGITYWVNPNTGEITTRSNSNNVVPAEYNPSQYVYVEEYEPLTTAKLSSGNLTVKSKKTKGSDLIDSVEFKNDSKAGTVYIKVETVDPFVSVSEKDLDFTVYLAHKGSKITDTEIQITGTMRNEEIEVDADEDEVNLSEGAYAKAVDYNRDIVIDTGNGLFINTKMFDGRKYYAKSVQDHITATDDELLAKYAEIDTIYTLYMVNMSSAGNSVEFDIGDKYYVYDADGKYIGTSDEKLPVSSKYYLATKQIDIDGAVEEDDGIPVDPSNPSTGGDDVPANANDNPGTGR